MLYEIEINYEDRVWRVEKRFKQFKELNQRLSEYFGNSIPQLPKQSYTTFLIKKSEQEIMERMAGLEDYLKQIIQNEQIVNSIIFQEFIQMPSQKLIKLQLDSVRTFELGLRDFHYYEDAIFVLLCEMSPISRASVNFQNMKFPWSDEVETSSLKPVGFLDCLIGPQLAWRKKYHSQPICMFCIKDNIIVGLDNGTINHSHFKQKKHLSDSVDYEQHTGRVMGLHIYANHLYSVSKDQRYRVRNIQSNEVVVDIYHKNELTCLKYDEERDYAFIGDRGGIIYTYQSATLKMSFDTNLQFIRDIILQRTEDHMIAIGFQTGQAVILNLAEKQVLLTEVTAFKNKVKSRCIAWSHLRSEVYIGNQEGYVTVWDIVKRIPVYEVKLHTGPITKIYWNEEEELLYTASKDKTLKVYIVTYQTTFFNKNKRDTQHQNDRGSLVVKNVNL